MEQGGGPLRKENAAASDNTPSEPCGAATQELACAPTKSDQGANRGRSTQPLEAVAHEGGRHLSPTTDGVTARSARQLWWARHKRWWAQRLRARHKRSAHAAPTKRFDGGASNDGGNFLCLCP